MRRMLSNICISVIVIGAALLVGAGVLTSVRDELLTHNFDSIFVAIPLYVLGGLSIFLGLLIGLIILIDFAGDL